MHLNFICLAHSMLSAKVEHVSAHLTKLMERCAIKYQVHPNIAHLIVTLLCADSMVSNLYRDTKDGTVRIDWQH
jgi:hypothetical protein